MILNDLGLGTRWYMRTITIGETRHWPGIYTYKTLYKKHDNDFTNFSTYYIDNQTPIHIKRRIYMSYIRPIWQYACAVWNSASNTHLHKIQTLQNRILKMVINAPWYVRNTAIHKDMKILFVTQTLHNTYSRHHSTLILHPNPLISNIPQHMPPDRQHRRLKWKRHTDILTQH
jgi:hypothetical protein